MGSTQLDSFQLTEGWATLNLNSLFICGKNVEPILTAFGHFEELKYVLSIYERLLLLLEFLASQRT